MLLWLHTWSMLTLPLDVSPEGGDSSTAFSQLCVYPTLPKTNPGGRVLDLLYLQTHTWCWFSLTRTEKPQKPNTSSTACQIHLKTFSQQEALVSGWMVLNRNQHVNNRGKQTVTEKLNGTWMMSGQMYANVYMCLWGRFASAGSCSQI